MKPHRKLVAAGMIAAAVSLAVAAPAYAAGASQAYFNGGTLYLQAASGAVNTFHMYANTADFAIYDSTTQIRLDLSRSGGCVQTNASVITCPLSVSRVFYELGDGNDRIQNDTNRRLTVYAGTGDDTVLGGSDSDEIDGQIGADWLEGRNGNDYVAGGDGDDDLYGGNGNDRMQGGAGVDEVHGESGDDTLMSVDARDRLLGSFGNDTIENSSFVDGGWDNDTVIVRYQGSGHLYGGEHYDTLDYSGWIVDVYVSLDGNSNDGTKANACDDWIGCPVPSGPPHNAHGDFERINGSANDDRISGNGEPDHIYGAGGNDSLSGNGGDDVLDAQQGAGQAIDGGSGSDICVGTDIRHRACELF